MSELLQKTDWSWLNRVLMPSFMAFAVILITGCDQLGIETPQKTAERQGAEAKAIGSACRHALRAIEDCYTLNPKADKSAVFGGWREMDEYMRENKLEGILPVVPRPTPSSPAVKQSAQTADSEDDSEKAPSAKSDAIDKREKPVKGKSAHSGH